MTPEQEQQQDRVVAAMAAAGIVGWVAVILLFLAALAMEIAKRMTL